MTAAKRKISVSLDADLVCELEGADESLSKQVNDAIRDTLERRRRQRQLGELLAELDGRHGPLPDTLVHKYEALLR
jgi:metal-responsive CopG/Arc/MetJ family transcriptional regulator